MRTFFQVLALHLSVFLVSFFPFQTQRACPFAGNAWAAEPGLRASSGATRQDPSETDEGQVQRHSPRNFAPDDYVIGQGDVLEVFIWRNEQLSRQVSVTPDGKISLPLVQDIHAEGLTRLQLKDRITEKLSGYIDNPRVTVIVDQINSYKVTVLGRVVRPGVYPITGKTTLMEAVSMAGGFTEWAKTRKISVIRQDAEKEGTIRVNYRKIASGADPSQNIVLHRGDTVIVP